MEHTSKKRTAKPYSPEFRARAVRLAMEYRDEYQSEAAALTAIAGKLGCLPDSLRVWMRKVQRDGGERPGQFDGLGRCCGAFDGSRHSIDFEQAAWVGQSWSCRRDAASLKKVYKEGAMR